MPQIDVTGAMSTSAIRGAPRDERNHLFARHNLWAPPESSGDVAMLSAGAPARGVSLLQRPRGIAARARDVARNALEECSWPFVSPGGATQTTHAPAFTASWDGSQHEPARMVRCKPTNVLPDCRCSQCSVFALYSLIMRRCIAASYMQITYRQRSLADSRVWVREHHATQTPAQLMPNSEPK